MSNDIETNHSDKIVCPFCGELYTDDIYEYHDSDGECFTCDECGKEFLLGVEFDVTFSTHRPDCKYKSGKEHEYGDVEQYDVDQEDCDRWNKTNFLDKHWEPNTVYKRYCKNCDDVKIIQLSFGSPVLEDF